MQKYSYIWVLLLLIGFVSCQPNSSNNDPSLLLSFSHDSLQFDTVFTEVGSATKRVMVYNPNKQAVKIEQVTINSRYFRINLDGENQIDQLRNITLRGGDSLYLFVRVDIDSQKENTPVLIEDSITFKLHSQLQHIYLEAYGQNVFRLGGKNKALVREQLTIKNTTPYLISDTIVVSKNLIIEEGAVLYMNNGAMIYAYGNVDAHGTLENPITIRGARTDMLFDSVPYRVASGQWNGIYLIHPAGWDVPTYQLHHLDITSGAVGLYVYSENPEHRPALSLTNSRIHNHAAYGLVLQNVDAAVSNTEISNCASYCVYLAGGTHTFTHNTIAAYYGFPHTTINIHNNILPDDVAAVYINNLSKNMAPTSSSFYNCIITGARKNNLVVATPLVNYYEGEFIGNYLRADSLPTSYSTNNTYAAESDSCVFRNTYYLYKEYKYYDFRLDSLSPARGIGDSIWTTVYPYDKLGNQRSNHPDAGCYEYLPEE